MAAIKQAVLVYLYTWYQVPGTLLAVLEYSTVLGLIQIFNAWIMLGAIIHWESHTMTHDFSITNEIGIGIDIGSPINPNGLIGCFVNLQSHGWDWSNLYILW